MIRIRRGVEPAALASVRQTQLTALRGLGRSPTSNEVDGYRIVALVLWERQRYKCCYCERKLTAAFNDVEHYRPKARANRSPGCAATHGYWWLAFTWDNLLFACPSCNRSNKNDQFPLRHGCAPLQAEQVPPGGEQPLLLNPGARVNPVLHIEYQWGQRQGGRGPFRWWARPRGGSEVGVWTIQVCGLNEGELPELRDDYVENVVMPRIDELRIALAAGHASDIVREHRQALGLLNPRLPYVALTFDALRHHVPGALLAPWGLAWPSPGRVG